jgi:hypothetical protein
MVISYSVSRQYMLSSVPIKCYNTALEIIEWFSSLMLVIRCHTDNNQSDN